MIINIILALIFTIGMYVSYNLGTRYGRINPLDEITEIVLSLNEEKEDEEIKYYVWDSSVRKKDRS